MYNGLSLTLVSFLGAVGHIVWLFLPLDQENLSLGYQENCSRTFLTWNIGTGEITSESVFIPTTEETWTLSDTFIL